MCLWFCLFFSDTSWMNMVGYVRWSILMNSAVISYTLEMLKNIRYLFANSSVILPQIFSFTTCFQWGRFKSDFSSPNIQPVNFLCHHYKTICMYRQKSFMYQYCSIMQFFNAYCYYSLINVFSALEMQDQFLLLFLLVQCKNSSCQKAVQILN